MTPCLAPWRRAHQARRRAIWVLWRRSRFYILYPSSVNRCPAENPRHRLARRTVGRQRLRHNPVGWGRGPRRTAGEQAWILFEQLDELLNRILQMQAQRKDRTV